MVETVTRAVFEAETKGVEQTAATLGKMAGAATGAAKAVDTFAKTTSTVADSIRSTERALEAEQKRIVGSSSAYRDYERSVSTLRKAHENGLLTLDQFNDSLRQTQNQLSKVVAPRLDMDAANSGLSSLLGNTEKLSAAQRQLVKDHLATAQARKTADAEAARGQALLMEQAQRLRMELDPLAAAQARLNVEVAEYQSLAARGAITSDELSKATAMANDRYQAQAVRLGAVGEAAKLSSNQLLNLSRQANDAATMALMGASPFMILASQGGQIFGALEENSRGVRGSIEAITNAVKGFVSGLGPVGIALGALGVAAAGFALITRRDVEPLEDVLKNQASAVRELRDAYGLAGDAAENYARRAPNAVRRRAEGTTDDSLVRAEQEIRARIVDQYAGSFNRLNEMRFEGAAELRAAFDELFRSLEDGTPRFIEFQDQLALIPDTDLPYFIRDAIKANIEWAASFAPLQQDIEGTQSALNGIALAAQNYSKAMGELAALTPDLRTNAERINDAFAAARAGPATGDEMVARFQREKAMAADTAGALQIYTQASRDLAAVGLGETASAVAEINARYDELENQYLGNAAALIALTEARQLAIQTAEAQSAFDLGEKAREEAEDYRKASNDRLDGIRQTVDALEMERSLLGRSEGEIAAARFAYQALAEAKRAAADAGMAVSPAEVAAIQEAAASIGALTTQINAMREAQAQAERVAETIADLQFQGSIFGLSETDREIAMTLNGLKLAYESLDGQRIVGAIRYNASLEETQEQLEKQRELVENVASTFLDIFTDTSSDGFFDRIMKGLADISRQFADLGKQRLLDMLSGGSVGYTSGFPAPGQRTVAPIGVPAPSLGGVRLYAPSGSQPSSASQAITEQLSANVTKTVSDSLLRNMLGSGKDPSHIRGLNAEFASSLTKMFEAAPEAIRASVTINSGFRSVARQAELFEGALAKYGSEAAARKWVAPPGRSQHNFGRAVDLGYGNSASREWVHQNAARFGLQFPMSHENWHIEPIGARSGGSATAMRSAVAGGVVDAQRALASGQASAPAMVPVPGSRPMQSGGGGFGGLLGGGGMQGIRDFIQSPLGMGGMNAFSAFGAGMSSGSPISGGFSGALGAFGMGLGPIGIIGGAAAGLLGGLFGRSKRKKEERRQRQEQERQQMLQAQQQLEQQLPAILELQDTLLDRASGTLTKERARIESQIKQYQTLAATAKNQTEIDRLAAMQSNLDDYMGRLYDELRLTAGSVVQSMMAGRGLESEFAKAVSGVREQSLAVRNYLADLTAAAGAGSAEVSQATAAGREQLLRQLSGAEEVTEIWTGLDRLSGTAAQLGTELQKLGMNAEEAAAAVRDHLNRGIGRMRNDFVRGIADETAEGLGVGYLSQVRALTERRDTMRADATSLGVDPTLIERWFGVQARNILDQAGLLDKEIAPLVKAFPDLASVLGDSSAKIERSLADAENDLRTAYGRVKQFVDQITAFRDDIKLDKGLSILGPEERLLEAQRQFRDQAAKAASGDAEAQGELIGLSRSYLDEAKAYYTSSEAYFAIFGEVDATLKSTEAKAVAELDLARSQYDALLKLDESILTIPQALEAMNVAQAARDTAQALALEAYVRALNPQAAIPSYQAPNVSVTQPPVVIAPAPAPAPPPVVTTPPAQIFYPWEDGWSPGWGGISPNWANKKHGGVIGFYNRGGVVGNGIWNEDSVLARYAGGGSIGLAGGEGILTAPAMRRPGVRSFMEAANADRLPEVRMPQIAMPSAPTIREQDNRELIAEVRALRAEVGRVREAVGLGAVGTIGAVERGTRVAQERAMEAKRQRAAA